MQRIVIKLGGSSFFNQGGFQSELRSLLEQYRNAQVYMIVGGGDLVEAMRTLHLLYPSLNAEELHWQCIELLDYSWSIASQVFPVDEMMYHQDDLAKFGKDVSKGKTGWVRVQAFYSKSLCEGIPKAWLPHCNWSTTSDALAWLLGMIVQADRVVLIKQCWCDPNWTIADAADRGVVDPEIARLSRLNPNSKLHIELRTME